MFTVLGSLLDRYWPIVVSLVGAVALALFGTVWSRASDHIGLIWTIVLISASGMASIFSGIYMAIAQEVRTQRTESDLLTILRSTIIPLAEQAITVKKPAVGEVLENFATELTLHCRMLGKDKSAVFDVNVYRLTSDSLERVNRASRAARQSFKRSNKKTARAREERRTVERIASGEATFCPDVRSSRCQRAFSLEDCKREYRSFISVPIFDSKDAKVIGMLSINSSKKNTLTEIHQSHLEAAAKIYAKVVALA